jgi:hypothetical protein
MQTLDSRSAASVSQFTSMIADSLIFTKGVRGKYVQPFAKGANVVVLDRDVAKIFPTSKAVNNELRVLAEAGKRHSKAKTRRSAT